MKTYIPPAGHNILWREIISALRKSVKKETYTPKFFDDYKDDQILYFNSGTSALYFLLKHLKYHSDNRRSEVILPAYTCPAVIAAVIRAKLRPVLSDVSTDKFSLRLDDMRQKINTNTLAIIQVELCGIIPYNKLISQLCRQNNITFIGDCAQSFGNYLLDKNLYKTQEYDYMIFSFGRGKPINLLHGGGILARMEMDSLVKKGPDCGIDVGIIRNLITILNVILYKIFFNSILYIIPRSIPFIKLGETIYSPDFKVKRISKYILNLLTVISERYAELGNTHRAISSRYHQLLDMYEDQITNSAYNKKDDLIRFPILFYESLKRNQILKELNRAGIGATGYYPHPLHSQPGLEEYGLNTCDNASIIAKRILTLPVHELLEEKHITQVHEIFRKYLLT